MSAAEPCGGGDLSPVLCFTITFWRGGLTAGRDRVTRARAWEVAVKITKRFSAQEATYLFHTAQHIHAASLQ